MELPPKNMRSARAASGQGGLARPAPGRMKEPDRREGCRLCSNGYCGSSKERGAARAADRASLNSFPGCIPGGIV